MPRRSKGPRLYLRGAEGDHAARWIIRDNGRDRGTGLGPRATEDEKAEALRAYLAEQHVDSITAGKRDPSQILVDDVLTLYARDVAPKHARPHETAARLTELAKFWKGKRLSDVIGATCRQYAEQRSTEQAARRDLEDLRAAIIHHRREGLHDKIVSVVLPERAQSRERFCTRSEAAELIWHAWRYREVQKGQETGRRSRRHVARFMLVAGYMGSRAAVICGASIEPKRPAGKPWVDLTTGVFYGRPVGQRETKKRRQTVRVSPRLLAHLRRWQRSGQRHVVEWLGEPVGRINKAHNAVVQACGLQDVTPHSWRHTAVTWAMQGGVDPWEAAEFFGMTVDVLIRVYGHHRPDHNAGVHRALSRRRSIA